MRVRIETAMIYVGGKPRRAGQIIDMPDDRAKRIIDADHRVGRPARITVLGTTQPEPRNINTMTREELIDLPGVGEDRADQIIELRPLESLDDATLISGIGVATVRRWKGVTA